MQPYNFKYVLDPTADYRTEQNRMYGFLAYAEAMYSTGELEQQLRFMDHTVTHIESKLWLAFLWGACYNAITPWVMLCRYETLPKDDKELADFYNKTFDDHRFDTDCRYRKAQMLNCIKSYKRWLNGRTQMASLEPLMQIADPVKKYEALWEASSSWHTFGRLAVWNYIEALDVVTKGSYDIDCQDFLLTDVTGSESNRNGVACAVGRSDLYTKHGILKATDCRISMEDCKMLNLKGEELFQLLRKEFGHKHRVTRLNVETVFCWYKKMYSRPNNSRYLGWDGDRTWDEMEYLDEVWPQYSTKPLYAARKVWLPDYLRAEDTPDGYMKGSNKEKMKVFYNTGKMPDVLNHQLGRGNYIKLPPIRIKQKAPTATLAGLFS